MSTFTKTTCQTHEHEHKHEHDQEPPIHGDILEAILSHVPLIHLIPASRVSKTWTATVSSAIRTTTTKPWLILHNQSYRHPYPTTTHAYDPDSNSWIRIHSPSLAYVTTLRSSHSNLLYMLTHSNLSFSLDPLHLTWHHILAPKVSRIDPIVAVVGPRVVVAGGAYDFENDPLAVEIHDLRSRNWTRSDPMPEFFNQSASATWLSVASTDPYLFVMEKSSGVTYMFNLNDNIWSGPYDLSPDRNAFYSVIGILNSKMIVIGVLGGPEDFDGVKVWEVDRCTFECDEIGTMPVDLVEELRRCDEVVESVEVVMAGNMVYMCGFFGGEEVVVCEVVDGGGCRWRRVVKTVVDGGGGLEKVVVTCSMVGVGELERAVRVENRRFVVKR